MFAGICAAVDVLTFIDILSFIEQVLQKWSCNVSAKVNKVIKPYSWTSFILFF